MALACFACGDVEVSVNFSDDGIVELSSAVSIHVNTLRVLVSCLLPLAAKNAEDPESWIDEMQMLTMAAADYSTFADSGVISSDLMKAAVISSLEEIFIGARQVISPR